MNLSCDQLNKQRCAEWQIDYILNLLDSDGNGMIDLGEFLENFYLINQTIYTNPQIETKMMRER